jgi:argininosuccinate lyase
LAELPIDVLQELSSDIDASVYEVLGTKNAVAAFCSEGSTAPHCVREQIAVWEKRLATD